MQFRRRGVMAALGAAAAGIASRPALTRADGQPSRPRVLATAEDFDRVARLLDGNDTDDTHAVSWYDGVRSRAREILAETSVDYTPSDRGTVLLVSGRCFRGSGRWGRSNRLSGDSIYADRAWRELEAVAAFDDWHPEHFLDVAEMTTAVATGYDRL